MSEPADHTAGDSYEVRGLLLRDHWFTVPLDAARPSGERLRLYAREILDAENADAPSLPWLLYLQGGPGGRGNRPLAKSGWLKEAAKDFRILMLDQRGTGLSTPADRRTLPLRGGPEAQAEYLAHFRADAIVADAEFLRAALGSEPWTIYGQSYGGFCALTYLSFAPEGLKQVLITGGLASLTAPADDVYRATYSRMSARNAEYFAKYPADRQAVTRILGHLSTVPEYLPTGERLSPERFQLVGNHLGGNTRMDGLHYLLEDAFVPTAEGERLSDVFLAQVCAHVSRAANPLYAVMHESIYVQGQPANWAAERVLAEFPDFRPDAAEPLLTGEHVFPWYFDQDPALVPLKETAHLLAARSEGWGALYDAERLAANTVPAAAAVYRDDVYVDRNLSMATAQAVRGMQVWETADYHHDGINDDGEAIFARLLGMVREAA